ncbi:MAG: pyrroline-5-carboxylate reductase [Bacteroidetes bacterium]|jgi:pyrroline-5-carboxylate reductase|nr:pyrroline-5-carboxylate reductase [Bacteroidota bacterium]MDF2451915.1 pyrroline-5-carboxylate reductase [Bacteroidota bacterium]
MNKIAIIGCGNMGLIYANSFLRYKIVTKENLLLVEKNEDRQNKLSAMNIGKVVTTDDHSISECNIVILAVKPQDFRELAGSLKKVISPACVVLSIMAGTEIFFIQASLNHRLIVRAMPNLPVEISMGMTAFSASDELSHDKIMLVENLLSTTGRTLYLKEENQLNAVTALSGSGPAYFFYFMKHLVDAGVKMGLDEHVSSILAKQTMLGSFHLINNGQKTLDEYIASVSSKGGTTEAALKTFNEHQMGDVIVKAIQNAENRAEELSIK